MSQTLFTECHSRERAGQRDGPVGIAYRRVVLAVALSFAAAEASAAPLDLWGTFASGFSKVCPGGLCGNDELSRQADGDFLQSHAEVSYLGAAGDEYRASATLVGGLALPELKALAIAPDSERFIVSTAAEGIQGYEYGGVVSTTYTLDVSLDGEVVGDGSISGFVIVLEADGFDPFGEFIGHRITNTSFLRTSFQQIDPTPLTFTLDPGAQIYIYAGLFASADSRNAAASADAFHTLTMSFRDGTGLAAASLTQPPPNVPEPLPAGLIGLGLLSVGALRLRTARWALSRAKG